MAVRKKRKKRIGKTYPRMSLDKGTEQYTWIDDMYHDKLFMKLLESDNRIYYNIVKNARENLDYSSAPIVRRNLHAACAKYKEYNEILK